VHLLLLFMLIEVKKKEKEESLSQQHQIQAVINMIILNYLNNQPMRKR
jgi:hypothetical protein